MNYHVQIVAQLSKSNVWNKENQQMKLIHNVREEIIKMLAMLILQNCAISINIWLDWIKKLGKKKLFLLSYQVQ